MYNVVIDTQVFLRALINRHSASSRLILHMQNDYNLYSAAQINREIMEVLRRPKIRAKFPQITDEWIEVIYTIVDQAEMVEINPEDIEAVSRDPKDDIFLACARLAQADFLVSEDKDLLVIEAYAKTKIVDVLTIIAVLASQTGS